MLEEVPSRAGNHMVATAQDLMVADGGAGTAAASVRTRLSRQACLGSPQPPPAPVSPGAATGGRRSMGHLRAWADCRWVLVAEFDGLDIGMTGNALASQMVAVRVAGGFYARVLVGEGGDVGGLGGGEGRRGGVAAVG